MLYSNLYFWLGQLGLVMTFISCAVLGHRFRTHSLLEILPFYFAGLFSLAMLVRPAIINIDHTIPAMPYLYRLSVGVLVASRAWVWRKKSSLDQVKVMDQIIYYLVIVCFVILVALGYKLKNK